MASTVEGKTIVVTGATSGIGEVAARELAMQGAKVLVVGRNPERVQAVIDKTRQLKSDASMLPFIADLSSVNEIRRLAGEIKNSISHLDVLLNNAGAFFIAKHISADGFEMTFALNHINYFLLTNELLELLRTSTPARIINVSSIAHQGGHINFDDLQCLHPFNGWQAYSNSKLMNVLFTYQLAQRLRGTNITVNALHPGFVASNFGKNNVGFLKPLFKIIQMGAITPEDGAKTSIYLASSNEVDGVTGKYFIKCKAETSSKESYDSRIAEKLWTETEKLIASV